MTLLVVYGMSSLLAGAVSAAGSVASTGAKVSATGANQNGRFCRSKEIRKKQG
jgi:hypothetical protein